jgi:hypothetical protein
LPALAIGSGSLDARERAGLTPKELTVLDTPATDMMKNYLTSLVDEQFAELSVT